jgi:hypothetical protein
VIPYNHARKVKPILYEIVESSYHENPIGKDSPGRVKKMKSMDLRSPEGKGLFGCVASLVLFAVAIYLGITLGPVYYSNFNLENGVKTTASRAGAHAFNDDQIIAEVMDLAKREDIRIKKENVDIDRFAGQVHIKVSYSVPINFILFERNLNFDITASSFIGSL